jgi:hypothetical protein
MSDIEKGQKAVMEHQGVSGNEKGDLAFEDEHLHDHTTVRNSQEFVSLHDDSKKESSLGEGTRDHWWQFWRSDAEQLKMKPVDFPRRTKRLILMTIALATLM